MSVINQRHSERFDAIRMPLMNLKANGERYVVPPFQRPYRWGDTQVTTLMNDLLDFFTQHQNDKETYSLGTIVCELGKDAYEILDGQQRLTTIDLLLDELGEKGNTVKHERLVSAYQYLNGKFCDLKSDLPKCDTQRNLIKSSLSKFIEENGSKEDELKEKAFYEDFRKLVLEKVLLQRVVIPLSAEVMNESPKMFEIINMRGQRLSNLDILKSRFLTLIDGNKKKERSLFNFLWTHLDQQLSRKNLKGFNLKDWKYQDKDETSSTELKPVQQGLTIEEIINTNFSSKAKAKENLEDEKNDCVETIPPIDVINILTIANELLKHWLIQNNSEIDIKPFALSDKDLQNRFNWILQSKDQASETNLWRLMSIVDVVLQTVTNWGPYRSIKDGKLDSKPDAFNQLVLSFYAANSYQHIGQYWLLLLSYEALKNVAPHYKDLPDSLEKLLSSPRVNFNSLKRRAYKMLVCWGYEVAKKGATNGTDKVFAFVSEFDENNQLTIEQRAISKYVPKWKYNGDLSQWDLYFLEYLLWCDAKLEGCEQLSTTSKGYIENITDSKLKESFLNFDWETFKTRVGLESIRIVTRGAVEHWLAQDKAELKSDKEAIDKELSMRHGFGNLALIDASTNSSLSKDEVSGKSKIVLQMSNPSIKLLWLAVFCSRFPAFDGKDVECVTDFWARYLADFKFHEV